MQERKGAPVLYPGDTIGILGGGQLGRMLSMAAARLGLQVIILDPQPECPASQVASLQIRAAYDNEDALAELASRCAVVTYEFENVPASAAHFLEDRVALFPGSAALENSQDRLVEKNFLNDAGAVTAPFHAIASLEDLLNRTGSTGFDGILKTRRLGYDGKGQARIRPGMNRDALETAWKEIGAVPAILEGFVPFEAEMSVIAARGRDGRIIAFDPARNVHRDGILRTSTVPAGITQETAARAIAVTGRILEAMDYVGVIGVEFFVLPGGGLLVNEMAPRVHNSGHWTEAACAVSQFEQHVRAIAGWPLADPARHSDCEMTNLIGSDVTRLPELLGQPSTVIHLYGKAEARPGRKMGHVTVLGTRTA